MRKGTGIRTWLAAAVAAALSVVVPSASGDAARGRFVPDEIIVKFRTTPADVNESVPDASADSKPRPLQDLKKQQGAFRIREIQPLLKDFDRRQARARAVRERDGARQARRQKVSLNQGWAIETGRAPDLGRIYRVRVELDEGQSLDEVLAVYRRRPDVEYAERNPVIAICATPDDRLYAEQWSVAKVQTPEAWDTCRGDRAVVVAVIDTGVDYNHRDLQSNMWVNEAELNGLAGVDDDGNGYLDDIRGYNFAYNDNDPADDHGHGTHCAGTIAAAGNNGLDIAGICWTARVMPLKILGADGDGTAADAVPAFYYAVANGAEVISGSWGGEDSSDALKEAIAYAHQEGVIVVAAAGNAGSNTPFYPAAYPEVISVAATESNDRRWYLSNYGDWVDIAAPGRDILSIRAAGTSAGIARDAFTCKMSGTSMAAPHVSGACALLLTANPLLTCDELHEGILKTGDPIATGICASNSRLNVYKALRAAIPAEGLVRLDRAYYREQADIGVLLADWDLRETGQQTVLLETAGGDQETMTLLETEVSLGVFRGTMASGSGAVTLGDNVLEVRNAEAIDVRYLDGNDGSGQTGRWRQAGAVTDYELPALSALRVERKGRAATIELSTNEPTSVEIRYGRIPGGSYDAIARNSRLSERHTIELHGLELEAPYSFVAALTDAAGNEVLADGGGRGYSIEAGGAFAGFRVPGVYPTIQAAIDDAVDGDIIWVADGTYAGGGNLEIDFHGKAITVRSENGPASCVIDCNNQGRAFYFHRGETADSILDGFTITKGGDVDYGGGIRCVGSSPTIRNCILLQNSARQYGGGLCNCYGSHPTVIRCTFEENLCSSSRVSGRGGGIANRHDSHPTVADCVFIRNSASFGAAALGNFDTSGPYVARCTFRGNSTDSSGGAVGNWGSSHATLVTCVFTGNGAEGDGGAVFNTVGSTAIFENCIFSGNFAERSGGAMGNYAATVTVANCTVSGNHAAGSCGGISSVAASEVRLDNCILWQNTANDAGPSERAQLVVDASQVRIEYCCVQAWSGVLGGLGNFGHDPLFVDPNREDFHLQSQGWRWDAIGTRWTYDAVTSPCIDAGNPGWPLGEEPTLVPEDPNGSPAGNQRIDMGAYGGTAEASLPPVGWSLLADLNNDDVVDGLDLAHLADAWLQAGQRHETDITRNGATDAADLGLLGRQWRHRVK